GDDRRWAKAVELANQGNAHPLAAVGYEGSVENNPVCRDVLLALTGGAKTGLAIRRQFMGGAYGWSQDPVDGALLALVVDGLVRASLHGKSRPAKELTRNQIGQTEFAREATPPPDVTQRIQLRKLITDTIGGQISPNDEGEAVRRLLDTLLHLAADASGPAPLPAPPSTETIQRLRSESGNDLLNDAWRERDTLKRDWDAWKRAATKVEHRLQNWRKLQTLLRLAVALPDLHDDVAAQVAAIERDRTLLRDPDPMTQLNLRLADALRAAVQEARSRMVEARAWEVDRLRDTPEWGKFDDATDATWRDLFAAEGVGPVPEIAVGTDEQLIRALEAAPLTAWRDRIAALPAKFERARQAAARR
ncbi:MAG TPA: hypothetical protein VFX03_10730, partial [Thermomicrobiales bacterium]|nr:hypothetical protein [Thermomicrobiales bacterium]